MRIHITVSAAVLALLAPAAVSQQQINPSEQGVTESTANAPQNVLDAFALRSATIQSILLPPSVGSHPKVTVEINGVTRTLDLRLHSLYGDDSHLLIDDGKSLTRQPMPPVDTYQGSIAGIDGSVVAAQIRNGQVFASIYMADGRTWQVEPVSDRIKDVAIDAHVVYAKRDAIVPDDVTCGVKGSIDTMPTPPANAPNALRQVEIATDLVNTWYRRNGSNTANSVAAAMRILNAVDAIYRRDVEICMKITTHIVRTRQVYSNTTSTSTLLQEMRTRWNANHRTVVRDIAHMFTAAGTFSGVIGTAFLTVVCSSRTTGAGYGVSKAISSATNNNGLVAHEMGHNWSARHCNASPPCYIMCSGLGGCNRDLTRFGNAAKAQILAHKNSRTCLDNSCGNTGCTNRATVAFYGTACVGTGRGPATCKSQNGTATSNSSTRWVANNWFWHACRNTTGRTLAVNGFAFLIRGVGGNKTIQTAIFRANGSPPTGFTRVSSQGTLTATTSSGYRPSTTLSTTNWANGSTFYVSVRAPDTNWNQESATGTNTTYYWAGNRPPRAWTHRKFAYRVNCAGGGQPVAPLLTTSGLPTLGGSVSVILSQAKPSSLSAFLLGGGRVGIPLPGTNRCFLYTNPVIVLLSNTSSTGGRTVTLRVPNNRALCNGTVQAQYAVRDNPPGNSLGVVTTRGAELRVGS